MEEGGPTERRSSVVGSTGGVDASGSLGANPATAPPTASDLFNRQVDLQKIEFLNDRVLQLQAENEALRERHDKREQETHEFVAYFQKEIQTRDKQITKLTEELAALKLSHALELEASQQAKETESQQLQQYYSNKEESFTEQLFFLKEELNQLETFKEMKETIHDKMKNLEALLTKERDGTKEQIGALERKFLEEKARLQKEHEKKIEIVKQQAKEDARNGLDADTRKIMTDNRRMGEELRFQLQMTEELEKEKTTFEAKAKKYHMEMQISKSKEEEYAAAAQKQAREIRQLRATIRDLEKQMSESVAALEREKYVLENKSEKEIEEMTLDVEGLRRLVRLKNKELRNLRRLAQTILDQRTDVEIFFLDALEHVKREIETERRRQKEQEMERYHIQMHKASGLKGLPLRFPLLSSSGDTSPAHVLPSGSRDSDSRHFSDKVDLRQLTWEDKERVLRLVFAKINGVQSYADATPQEPSPQLPPEAGRKRSQNQEVGGQGPAVYFATEPTPPTNSVSTANLRDGPAMSMSLSGLAIGSTPQPPSGRNRRR
ncbi:hypothetical protein Poli38472_005702 [Pythium oligandrum]|uniref:Basal body-orientation factor 1 n=1 Tax=Pythium oligandrum TaxID=41045 RepID=A0A8K1CGG6_PYTOL|nr:hypothetical protein Poli38472_005702 [Pythium oligandrum]|eukprot:TMW63084.1 hypothetical protein Poli38472_005702 [Pythium oligandrum]